LSSTVPLHPRFRQSTLFSGLTWLTESSRYPGTNSDMHWLAWAEDGTIYTVDDDGVNFGSPWNFGQLMRGQGHAAGPHGRAGESVPRAAPP
jgi:hypothetical protein